MDCKRTQGLILLFLCLSVQYLPGHGQNPCKTTSSPCKCDTDAGLIDLTPLDNPSGDPKFSQMQDVDYTGYYSYNPCTPYTLSAQTTENGCIDVLGCQQLIGGTESFALGDANSPEWKTDAGIYVIHLTATDPIDYQQRIMTITLTCDPSAEEPTFTPSGDGGSLTYPMTLTSKYACPSMTPSPSSPPSGGGLSVGSVLCIIFAVCVTTYLVAGCLYNYFRKGARGQEVVPNVAFWKEFPFYVKDGTMFIVYKVKGKAQGYQDIK